MVTFPANEAAVITAVKADPILTDLRETLDALKKSIDEQVELTRLLRSVRATLEPAPSVGASESTVLSRALRQAQELLKHS
jgi:hypothetical protein